MYKKHVKMTVNIPNKAAEDLRKISEDLHQPMSVVVSQAIALDKFFRDEIRDGAEIKIVKNGITRILMVD